MRISDWSSDVCSSDLTAARRCWPARSGSRPNGCASAATTRECLRLFTVRRQIQTVHPSTSNVSSGCNPRRAERGCHHHIIRSEEHTSELQSLMRISYAVFCLKNKRNKKKKQQDTRKQS